MCESKNSGDSVLCAIHMEHCNTVLEATDVWLKTFDTAAFMLCIRMELQAPGTHPDLEDTAFRGDMAVLPPKLCSCKLKMWEWCPVLYTCLTSLLRMEWQTRLVLKENYTSS